MINEKNERCYLHAQRVGRLHLPAETLDTLGAANEGEKMNTYRASLSTSLPFLFSTRLYLCTILCPQRKQAETPRSRAERGLANMTSTIDTNPHGVDIVTCVTGQSLRDFLSITSYLVWSLQTLSLVPACLLLNSLSSRPSSISISS